MYACTDCTIAIDKCKHVGYTSLMRTLNPRDHTLFARVTSETWTELYRAAKANGYSSVSELVRELVADYLTKQKKKR